MPDPFSPLALDRVVSIRNADAAFEADYASAFGVEQARPPAERWDLGAIRVEVRSADAMDTVAPELGGRWLALRWSVDSLDRAVSALADHGIGVASRLDGLVRTDPSALGGLRLELREGRPAVAESSWPNPLGIKGKPGVKVASLDPAAAAAALAGLLGSEPVVRERVHLNTIGHAVSLADHVVEFVGSSTSSSADLVGAFLEQHGEAIYALALPVADFHVARGHLTAHGVPFNQWGRHALVLGPREPRGPLVELTDAP